MRHLTLVGILVAAVALLAAVPAAAGEVSKSYRFALNQWHEIDATDGPVTLQRIRLDPKEGRLTKSSVFRPHNHEYLETVDIQLEYTNNASINWRTRVAVRWLDAEGRVIDGFSGNERLAKKSASKIARMSVSTLTYGVEQAETLEVEISFQP